MRRLKSSFLRLIVPRQKGVVVRLLLAGVTVASLVAGWWLSVLTSDALLLPPTRQELDHLLINRSLKAYFDNITLLIQPSTAACDGGPVPVVAVVTSTPLHLEQRMAIRNSWGKMIPTYFLLGLLGTSVDSVMVDNYVEAKQYGDIIIYQFQDHYQNLTIKTALLLKWAAEWCSTAGYLLKVDDDILVNPWTLGMVVADGNDADLIGYRKENTYFHRDAYNKWYTPRWLYRQDMISEYLSGTAYLINGRLVSELLTAAYDAPMINLEDVYFTYVVAKLKLGLNLTHDYRLNPYKPRFASACMYWGLASAHSHTPSEMTNMWPNLKAVGEQYDNGVNVCGFHQRYLASEMFLY